MKIENKDALKLDAPNNDSLTGTAYAQLGVKIIEVKPSTHCFNNKDHLQ